MLTSHLAGILGPAISAINGVLVAEFDVSYRTVATWSGWQFWSAGVAGVFASSVGRIWGKRPVYLVSIVLVLIGAIWNAATRTSTGFLVSRTIEGFGMGAFESIVPSTIGDLFYVHERGKRVAFYNFSFLGSVYFMPILAGYISMKKGWRTQFIIISALLGVILVLAFFLLPEHVYNRPAVYDTDTHSTDRVQELAETPEKHEPVTSEGESKPESVESANVETRRTWVQDLKLYNGRFSDEPFWKCFLVPFVLMGYPATWWAFLLQGTFVTWVSKTSFHLSNFPANTSRASVSPSSSHSFSLAHPRTLAPTKLASCTPPPSSAPSSPTPSPAPSPTAPPAGWRAATATSTSPNSGYYSLFRPRWSPSRGCSRSAMRPSRLRRSSCTG